MVVPKNKKSKALWSRVSTDERIEDPLGCKQEEMKSEGVTVSDFSIGL